MALSSCKEGSPDAARSVRASEVPATNVAGPLSSAIRGAYFLPIGSSFFRSDHWGRCYLFFNLGLKDRPDILGIELLLVSELEQKREGHDLSLIHISEPTRPY